MKEERRRKKERRRVEKRRSRKNVRSEVSAVAKKVS